MKTTRSKAWLILSVLSCLGILACNLGALLAEPTPTPTNTVTPSLTPTSTPTETLTPTPTLTPLPTATPDRLVDLDLALVSLRAEELSSDPVAYGASVARYTIFNSAPNPADLVQTFTVSYERSWKINRFDIYDAFDQTIYLFKTEELAHQYFKKELKGVPSGRGRIFEPIGMETRGFYFGGWGSGVFWRYKEAFVLLIYRGTRIQSGEDASRLANIIQARLEQYLK